MRKILGRAELLERDQRQWNGRLPDAERCNIQHTSDSAAEAVHYIEVVFPQRTERLIKVAHAIGNKSGPL